jgi:tetratricopeptide (TPR) repeat protein
MELFELYLSPIDATRFKVIVNQSPAGEGETESSLPFCDGSQDWRTTLIRTLESASFRSENFDKGEQEWMVTAEILAADRTTFHPDYQAKIGKELYRALFPPGSKVERALHFSLRQAEEKNTQLLVQLKLEADAVQRSRLSDYPWELLHDGQRFLLHHQLGFSRYIAHDTTPPSLPPVEQVNVLLVSSAASDSELGLKPLSKKEQQAIRKGLEKASDAGHICLRELEYPTFNELRTYLTENRGNEAPHVLHFDGHGLFGKRCQQCGAMHKGIKVERCRVCQAPLPDPQGYLVFEDEEGEADYISAKELGTRLHQARLSDGTHQTGGVALVVLSACKSGMAIAGESVFNGTAQNLIGHRVPAVVAMQYTVSVKAAIPFAEQFYRSLGQKDSLSVAVNQGREAMGADGNQWYRPVLYLRWRDNQGGQLFATSTIAGIRPEEIPSNLPRSGVIQFVARDEALKTLRQQLQQKERVAICAIAGMGGVGKTELALQYAQSHQQQGTYPGGLCWLQAADAEIGTQIVSFARVQLDLQIPDGLDLPQQVAYCWRRWRGGVVLLVLDDVRSYEKIKPYLPPAEPRFKVLITTRRLGLGESFELLRLEVLSEEAAIELLVSFVGDERIREELDPAKQLCAELGYLPLGLELVGRYLKRKPDLSLAQMRQRLGLEHRSLQQRSEDMTARLGVTAAFELSWQELDELDQQLGCLLSLFALAPIPWSLVEQSLPDQEKEALEDARDEALLNLSLLERRGQGSYQLHQLIREFLRSKLTELAETDQLKRGFCQAMVAAAQQIPETLTLQHIAAAAPIIPHIVEAVENQKDWLSDEGLIWSFVSLGRFYEGQGVYSRAESWKERCLLAAQERLGDNHPLVATSLNNLAILYREMGRYEQAEPLFQQALEMRKQLLGNDHPDVANSLNNLALLYHSSGRYEQAEPLYQQALKMIKRLLGGDHLWMATSLNNLGELYRVMGRYEEAELLCQQALEISKRLLGNDSRLMANSLNNLASLYHSMKRYEQAEPLYQQALEMSKRLLGDDHLYVATCLSNLAVLYRRMERYEQAEPLYQQSLEMIKRLLGDNHPLVATNLNNLAELYRTMGCYEQAEPLYQQALEMSKHLLGDDNLDVATSLVNLAEFYESQGCYEQAQPLYQQALEIYKHLLANDHLDIATSLQNLARLYYLMGQYEQAEPLYQQSLEMIKRLLGDDHPLLAASQNNLAELYRTMGCYEQAESLFQQALEMSKRLLGNDHPDVATSLNNLALIYRATGRYEQAEPLYQQALEIYKRLLGDDHPDVATSLNNLAGLYRATRRYKQAELLYQQALEMRKRLLGNNHPDVATSLYNLAGLYESQGRYKQAEPLYLKALKVAVQSLGANHPNTVLISNELQRLRDHHTS